jgi:uncharacterized membrane protein
MRIYAVMLFLHLLAVVIWVGGMFVMHFAVRPSAVELLAPPQRLPLMAATLRRFFNWVIGAVVVTLLSGLAMFIGIGAAAGAMQRGQSAFVEGMRLAHVSIHLMFALGVLMMLIFVFIRSVPYRALQRAVGAQDWSVAGQQLNQVRALVALNLALGVVTIAVATVGRAFIG